VTSLALHYKVKVLTTSGKMTNEAVTKLVQGTLDNYVKADWRLHSMTCLSGRSGVITEVPVGPYLVLVFESGGPERA